MSVLREVVNVAHRLAVTPGIDISRLSYELSPAEWESFRREAEDVYGRNRDLSYLTTMTVGGLRIVRRADSASSASP